MVRYAIVNDAGLFFTGFRPNSNRDLHPHWDTDNACIFNTRDEAEYSLTEIGEGRIATLIITL